MCEGQHRAPDQQPRLTIGIRFALYAILMLLFGLQLFAWCAARRAGRDRGHAANGATTIGLSVAALLLSGLSLAAMTASMAGVTLAEVDRAMLGAMLFETPMGSAWLVRSAALVAGLFVAMLALAAANRFRLTPAFERAIAAGDVGRALAGLRVSLAAETTAAVAIVVLVAWLGTLPPPTVP